MLPSGMTFPAEQKERVVRRRQFVAVLAVGLAAPLLSRRVAIALDDGTPDYVRNFGVIDQGKYERLKRFNNVVVIEIGNSPSERPAVTIPALSLVAILNKDKAEHTLIFPAAKGTGMDFDLMTDIVPPGSYWSGKFDTVGTFTFTNASRPDEVWGTITVEPQKQ